MRVTMVYGRINCGSRIEVAELKDAGEWIDNHVDVRRDSRKSNDAPVTSRF